MRLARHCILNQLRARLLPAFCALALDASRGHGLVAFGFGLGCVCGLGLGCCHAAGPGGRRYLPFGS